MELPMSLTRFIQQGALFLTLCVLVPEVHARNETPHLARQGTATQLIVDGEPFIMLAGELHNSSASSMAYMEPMWDKLVALNLNTVLATVAWELVEPEEGQFDFSLIDGLLAGARKHDLKLVLLWFGSWKNGESSYIPNWVKQDLHRFPRAQGENGSNKLILSPLHEASCQADAKAFAALMRHLRKVDGRKHTVIAVQVENEVGIRPESRDHSAAAEIAFRSEVPGELLTYLKTHRETLLPEVKDLWAATGYREDGTWAEVFGSSPWTDELFMAWHMARYIDKIVRAGKAEYPLPMYANAWLVQNDEEKPGDYPSGGPVSRVMDIWRAAAPNIDFLAPDIYLTNFKAVCAKYVRSGNPLMIPEARRGPEAARNVFWAIAELDAMCFAPFGIESIEIDHPLVDSYQVLRELMPLVSEYQGTSKMAGLLQESVEERTTEIVVGDYRLHVLYDRHAKDQTNMAYGLIINTAPNEYVTAGNWFELTFSPATPGPSRAGILQVWEGHYERGRWIPGRCLNGDETLAHSRIRLPSNPRDEFAGSDKPRILHVTLYRHD